MSDAVEYHFRHIQSNSEQSAADILNELQRGGVFEDLAKRNSRDQATSDGGGDCGWVAEEKLPASIVEELHRLKPGRISLKPVRTDFGWHLLKLVETRPYTPPPPPTEAEIAERKQRIREQFDFIDQDGDGEITQAELKAWATRGGASITDATLREVFGMFDADKSGKITFAEWESEILPK
ncbi:peptidylprolyl isomerase [Streptomyces xanthochromogenes]|uniref:peptidylprolyl isomerase n=1 Tax=Streptomyces xanthochromogenes TaxID=67384 RepID=UPI0038055E68